MDLWNWNFNLQYRSVNDNASFWPYDSNQPNNDIYEQNVAKLKIVPGRDPVGITGISLSERVHRENPVFIAGNGFSK